MNGLIERLGPKGLTVLAIGLDTRAEPMARFIAKHAPRFTVLWDPRHATPAPYEVEAMPSSCLVDPHGALVWRHRGFSASDAPAMEAGISQRMGLS